MAALHPSMTRVSETISATELHHATGHYSRNVGGLERPVAWFVGRGVIVEQVLSDSGSAYVSHDWRKACTKLGITHKRIRPYRPLDERQDRALPPHTRRRLGLCPLLRLHRRRNSRLPAWLHFYNHHRAHSALGGRPPVTRLTSHPGHHT